MTFEEFKSSLNQAHPPSHLSDLLKALWYDGKGDWHQAHDIADGHHDPNADWVHAYLHRKEGDQWNANYWYRRAGRKMPNLSLDAEWEDITNKLLKK